MSNRSITQLTFTCSKSTISTLEDGVLEDVQSSGVFIVNFEHYAAPFSSVSIADFEQGNVSREAIINPMKHHLI